MPDWLFLVGMNLIMMLLMAIFTPLGIPKGDGLVAVQANSLHDRESYRDPLYALPSFLASHPDGPRRRYGKVAGFHPDNG